MSALSDMGWSLQYVRPDKDGKTVTYILDEKGKRIAVSKARKTGEEAYAEALEYAEARLLKERK